MRKWLLTCLTAFAVLSAASSAHALQMATGDYVGDSQPNRQFTNVGFQPDFVMIKAANSQVSYLRTSSMPPNTAKPLGIPSPLNPDRIVSLDANGFTVGSMDEVNLSGVRFYWVAIQASPGQMVVDSYTGAAGTQVIAGLGFRPEYVIVMSEFGDHAVQRFPGQTGDNSFQFDFDIASTNRIESFDTDGFTVGSNGAVGSPGTNYHYVAFNFTPQAIDGGRYFGDGGNNRTLDVVGFQPEWIIAKGNSLSSPVHRPASLTGDSTLTFIPDSAFSGGVKALLLNGFLAGSHPRVNSLFVAYDWVAFRGATQADIDVAVLMTVDNATPSEGDSINFTITAINNGPTVATNIAILDSLPAGLTYAADAPRDGFYTPASGIWAIDSIAPMDSTVLILTATVDAGTIGSSIGNTAELVGLDQNDTLPGNNIQVAQINVQASGFRVATGAYDGDGQTGQAVVVGFRPDVVIVKSDAADAAVMRTSTMGPDESKDLANPTALIADRITAFTANGFTVGADPAVNDTTSRFYWVAFRADSTNMVAGSYTGDNGNPREIPVGFRPGYVIVLAETAEQAMQRFEAQADDQSLRFDADNERPNRIERFTANGFEVGGHNTVNNSGDDYHFVAWKSAPNKMATGSYPGDTNDNRNVTGIGVDPDYVIVRVEDVSAAGVHHTSSLSGDATLSFDANPVFGNGIQTLLGDGFQVGTDPSANSPGKNYFWVAFQGDSLLAPALIDSAGTLFPASAFENDPALGLHVALNNASTTGVTLDTGSTVSFSDGSQVYTAALANPTYIPPLANNFTVTFSSAPVPVGFIAPALYDLTLDLQGLDDQGAAYAISIVTTGRNSILIDTPKIMVGAEPLDVIAVRPGARDVPLIVLNFENGYFDTRSLDTLTVTNASIGPGTQIELDAEIEQSYLYHDVDGSGSLTPPDTLVLASVVAAGRSTFTVGGTWQLPGLSTGTLIVVGDVDSTQARDSDALDVVVESPGDIIFQPGTLVDNSFDAIDPLDSFGRAVIDGMALHQIALTPSSLDTLDSGTTDNLLLTVVIPQNGYEADTLSALSLRNYAPDFDPADVSAFRLYADDGDATFNPAVDTNLGSLVFSGEQIVITGLTVAVNGASTLFVTADVAAVPTNGNHLQLGIPFGGIDMRSSNDGPVDGSLVSSTSLVFRRVEKVDIVQQPLAALTVRPGDSDVPMLSFSIDNNTLQTVQLDSLRLDNTSIGVGSIADLDNTFAGVELYIDDGNGVVDGWDTVVASAFTFSGGGLVMDGLGVVLAPDEVVHFLIAADVDSVCARDSDSLRVRIADVSDLRFDMPVPIVAGFPLETTTLRGIDGMMAHQIRLSALADSLVVAGSNNVLMLDFGIPANAYSADTLQALSIHNVGTATSEHFVRLALYRDGGNGTFDSGAGDDIYLGDFIENVVIPGGHDFEIQGLSELLNAPCGTTVGFYIASDISLNYTVGGSVQMSVPVMGISVASGNDGPIDIPVQDPATQVLPRLDELTVFPYSVGDQIIAPGSSDNLNFGIGFYNGFSFPLQLETMTLNQLGSASTAEADSFYAYADADTNGLFDPGSDVRIAAVASGDPITFDNLGLGLPAQRVFYVFVSYDARLAVRDSATFDLALLSKNDLTVLPSNDVVAGEIPMEAPGIDVIDGMVAQQISLQPVASDQVAPNDSDVLALSMRIPANGPFSDRLRYLSIENAGSATAGVDIASFSLWKESGGDPAQFEPALDQLIGALDWNTVTWTNATAFDEFIGAGGLQCYVTFTASSTPTDGATVQARVPVDGVEVLSGNDGPNDAAVANPFALRLSTDPLITGVRADRDTYSSGQTVLVEMVLRNVGVDTLYSVMPSLLSTSGTGSVIAGGGPTPASVVLPPGQDSTIVWSFTAGTAGFVDVCGQAFNSDSSAVSEVTCASFLVQNQAGSLPVDLTNFAPASVNRAQENVTLFKVGVNYTVGDSSSVPAELRTLRLVVEDDTGAPLPPNSVLEGLRLVAAGDNQVFALADSTSNPLLISVQPPITVIPGDSLSLTVITDIAANAALTPFRLAFTAITDIDVVDRNTGASITLNASDGFPWSTTAISVNEPAESLLVAQAPPTTLQVNTGQRDVELYALTVTSPGSPTTASTIVTGLTVALFDTTGMPVPSGSVVDRIHVRSGGQELLSSNDVHSGSNEMRLDFATPLIALPNTPTELAIAIDVSPNPAVDGLVGRIAGALSIVARDINDAQLVVVAAKDPATADFPMSSNRLIFQAAAGAVSASYVDQTPAAVLPNSSGVPVLDLVIDHGGLSGSSAVLIDSLALFFRDTGNVPLPPGDYFGALYIVHEGDTVSTITSLSSIQNNAEANLSTPVTIMPASAETLSVFVDARSVFNAVDIEVWLDQQHIVLLDVNDDSRVAPINGLFPFVAGPMSLQLPGGAVQCAISSLLPQNVATTEANVEAFDLLVQNAASAGSTPAELKSLRIGVFDGTGAPVQASQVVSGARLVVDGSTIAAAQIGVNDIFFTIPDDAVIIPAGEMDTMLVVTDIDSRLQDFDFRFAITDTASSVVEDAVTGDPLIVGTVGNVGYPLETELAHVLGDDVESGFTNYPNPFSAGKETTRITYYLSQTSTVTLTLFTIWGAPVSTLMDNVTMQPGLHQDIEWNGVNGDGDVVNNGVYLLVLQIRGMDGASTTIRRKVGVVR